MRDPSLLTYPEILQEIQSLRASMREGGRRIHELSRVLMERVRREGANEFTSRYIAFSNANMRFVGGVEQGVQRIASFDRAVGTIEREREQVAEQQEAKAKAEKRSARTARVKPLADLTELYGQEMIDAAR